MSKEKVERHIEMWQKWTNPNGYVFEIYNFEDKKENKSKIKETSKEETLELDDSPPVKKKK